MSTRGMRHKSKWIVRRRYYYIQDGVRYPIDKRTYDRMKNKRGNVLSMDTYY